MSQITCTYCGRATNHRNAMIAITSLPREGRFRMNVPLCRLCSRSMEEANRNLEGQPGYFITPDSEEPYCVTV